MTTQHPYYSLLQGVADNIRASRPNLTADEALIAAERQLAANGHTRELHRPPERVSAEQAAKQRAYRDLELQTFWEQRADPTLTLAQAQNRANERLLAVSERYRVVMGPRSR
jgi:hypothetical protein